MVKMTAKQINCFAVIFLVYAWLFLAKRQWSGRFSLVIELS